MYGQSDRVRYRGRTPPDQGPQGSVREVGVFLRRDVNPPGAIRLGTVGKALPGARLKLAEDGELLLAGPTLMKG